MLRTHGVRRAMAASFVLATAMVMAACAPDTPTGPAPTTAPGTTKTVSNATFEWTISREADNGAFAPGEVNYWSAGQSDSTEATYNATNGNVTVLKKNASGTYVPLKTDASVSWANRNKDGAGNVVTASNAFYLGQKFRYTNGTGTVNTSTGAATIQWTGTFTVNFYGKYVPFWFTNPKLTVDPGGAGRITATMGGYASTLENPDVRTPLTPVNDVVVAEFTNVYAGGAIATGFTSTPKYLGTTAVGTTGAPQQALIPGFNNAYWGSWPASFLSFQNATGLVDYWYTSGGAADAKKPQEPVSIAYTLNP